MIRLRLNRDRHLQALTVIPLELDAANEPAPARSTGRYCLTRQAWIRHISSRPSRSGRHHRPSTHAQPGSRGRAGPFASRGGCMARPARILSIRPKLRGRSAPPQPPGAGYTVYVVALLTMISVLGWHNLRRGRGDLRGATRFALFIAAAAYIRILLMAPHAGGCRGFQIFVAIMGNTLVGRRDIGIGLSGSGTVGTAAVAARADCLDPAAQRQGSRSGGLATSAGRPALWSGGEPVDTGTQPRGIWCSTVGLGLSAVSQCQPRRSGHSELADQRCIGDALVVLSAVRSRYGLPQQMAGRMHHRYDSGPELSSGDRPLRYWSG